MRKTKNRKSSGFQFCSFAKLQPRQAAAELVLAQRLLKSVCHGLRFFAKATNLWNLKIQVGIYGVQQNSFPVQIFFWVRPWDPQIRPSGERQYLGIWNFLLWNKSGALE